MEDEVLRNAMARIMAIDSILTTMLVMDFAKFGAEYVALFKEVIESHSFSGLPGALSDADAEWFADVAVQATEVRRELIQRAAQKSQELARRRDQSRKPPSTED